jgi:hypothetical protein
MSKHDKSTDVVMEAFLNAMLCLLLAVLIIPAVVLASAICVVVACGFLGLIAIGVVLQWWKQIIVLIVLAIVVWGMVAFAR